MLRFTQEFELELFQHILMDFGLGSIPKFLQKNFLLLWFIQGFLQRLLRYFLLRFSQGFVQVCHREFFHRFLLGLLGESDPESKSNKMDKPTNSEVRRCRGHQWHSRKAQRALAVARYEAGFKETNGSKGFRISEYLHQPQTAALLKSRVWVSWGQRWESCEIVKDSHNGTWRSQFIRNMSSGDSKNRMTTMKRWITKSQCIPGWGALLVDKSLNSFGVFGVLWVIFKISESLIVTSDFWRSFTLHEQNGSL